MTLFHKVSKTCIKLCIKFEYKNMKQNNVNVSIVPDKCRIKEDETFPLKLRVTYKGIRKYYATGYDANLQDWEAIQKDNVRGKINQQSFVLREIRLNAENTAMIWTAFLLQNLKKHSFQSLLPLRTLKQHLKIVSTD